MTRGSTDGVTTTQQTKESDHLVGFSSTKETRKGFKSHTLTEEITNYTQSMFNFNQINNMIFT